MCLLKKFDFQKWSLKKETEGVYFILMICVVYFVNLTMQIIYEKNTINSKIKPFHHISAQKPSFKVTNLGLTFDSFQCQDFSNLVYIARAIWYASELNANSNSQFHKLNLCISFLCLTQILYIVAPNSGFLFWSSPKLASEAVLTMDALILAKIGKGPKATQIKYTTTRMKLQNCPIYIIK